MNRVSVARCSTIDRIIEIQHRWAEAEGLSVDACAYLDSSEENLLQPLSPLARIAFEQGNGSELKDRGNSPAKMRALHSSSALAVNVFDYWSLRESLPLTKALEVEHATGPLQFEKKYPTGLRGNPPNLDVVLPLQSGITFAIESKFTEWLAPKSGSASPFKNKYFESDNDLWHRVGLPECQRLAQDVQVGTEPFVHLDAPQLLKHALGLAKQTGQRFSLCYLYYDWPSAESEIHHLEIARFAGRVGSELRFRTIAYQDLFRRLAQRCDPCNKDYIEYLRNRYFKDAP
jgi:hypothetical protein